MAFVDEKNVLRVVSDIYKHLPTSSQNSTSSPSLDSPSTRSTSSNSSTKENNKNKSLRKQRSGGKESFGTSSISYEVGLKECERCYRVLTYKQTSSQSPKILVDLLDGKVFNSKITSDAVVYKTRQGALSERFPANQVGHPKSGSGNLPRVLVAFDCWGDSIPRTGGGISCVYQFAKFVGIVECLDPISPHPLKHATIPVSPHFFPPRDTTQPPRQQNNRTTRVTRSLNA